MISITCDKCKKRIDFSARIEVGNNEQSLAIVEMQSDITPQIQEIANHSFALDDKRYLICKACNTDYENISHELELANTKQLKEWIEKV